MKIATHLARIPPSRPGNVAFFANLAHIFFDNVALTDELRDTVRNLDTYGGRLYPMIGLLWDGPDNHLFVECLPSREFTDYFGRTLGLRLPEVHLFDPDQDSAPAVEETIRQVRDCAIDGFVTDERLAALAASTATRLAGSVAGSRRGNNKSLLHQFLAAQGLPVFDTIMAVSPAEVPAASDALAARGYRQAVLKAPVGASGIGLVRFDTNSPPEIPTHHFLDGACLVQGWLDASFAHIRQVSSPSVQILVTEQVLHLYDLTDQILGSDSVHEGNIAPPESFRDPSLREELLRQAVVGGQWLHAQGYRGTASVDFHLAFLENGETEVRVCELNARVTGATYPSLLARHFLPEGAWLMRNLHLPSPLAPALLLDELDRSGLLFKPGARCGILPINFNTTPQGLVAKGQFLLLGPDHAHNRHTMEQVLGTHELAYVRD